MNLVEAAQEAALHAIATVDPTKCVKRHVRTGAVDDWLGDREHPERLHVLALGKAAPRMVWGLVEANVPFRGVGIHAGGVPVPNLEGFRWLRGDHPTPGDGSFAAGEAILAWLEGLPADTPLLVLLSGGGSSLAEVPADGVGREGLVEAWDHDLRAGLAIEDLNERRAERSRLKDGGMARLAGDRPVRVWCLSDVPPDRLDALASGPFWDRRIEHTVLASNDDLVQAAGVSLQAQGFGVYRHAKRIQGPVEAEVERFLAAAGGLPGRVALVGGGEPVVALPDEAPPGGRCQHAALVAARRLERGVFLAAASDGRDGTDVALAWARPGAWDDDASGALERFDAARWLAERGLSLSLGSTGTNVADVWIWLDADDAPKTIKSTATG